MKPSELIQTVTTSLIALIAVTGTFAIIAYQIVHHETVAVPDLVALLVGSIVGTYFGHANAINGARQAGTAAGQAAVAAADDRVAHVSGTP